MMNESAETDKRAWELALHRLSVREYSAVDLRRYLIRKGFEEALAREIVARLVDDNAINDRRYARVMFRGQAMRGKGPAYAAAKVRAKGVNLDRDDAKALFREAYPEKTEAELARETLERRYPEALAQNPDLKLKNRAYQALLRRGFSPDSIRRAFASEDADG